MIVATFDAKLTDLSNKKRLEQQMIEAFARFHRANNIFPSLDRQYVCAYRRDNWNMKVEIGVSEYYATYPNVFIIPTKQVAGWIDQIGWDGYSDYSI